MNPIPSQRIRGPIVDVVVPCYNYARYLDACVQSVLQQPGVDVRVLIIDDESADDTPEVANRLCADARVRFRRHAKNRGHIATYNEGLSEATGDYVVLLSADDMLTPGALQRAVAVMEADARVGFVYGCPIALYGDRLPPARAGSGRWTVWDGHAWIAVVCRTGRNCINSPEVVMRTRVQHAIGGYRPSLPHSGDLEMWLRAAAVADVGWIHGADQAYYRVHAASMQRTAHAGVLRDLQGRLDAYESVLGGPHCPVPGASALLLQARRALALIALRQADPTLRPALGASTSVEDHLGFARAVYPPIVGSFSWRAAERLRRPRSGLAEAVLGPVSLRLHWLRRHLEWRRWSRTGVY
jgi:hypothetical protein